MSFVCRKYKIYVRICHHECKHTVNIDRLRGGKEIYRAICITLLSNSAWPDSDYETSFVRSQLCQEKVYRHVRP